MNACARNIRIRDRQHVTIIPEETNQGDQLCRNYAIVIYKVSLCPRSRNDF